MTDVFFDNKVNQVAFLNNLVSTNNLPSKYDSYNTLYDFVVECIHMSQFVDGKNKKCNASSSHNTSLPNSVDKILETIITLIDTDTPELSEEQQNILHSLELELDTCT